MHIESHARETVQKMHELFMAVQPLEIKSELGKMESITPEDIEKLIAAYKSLNKHLFDYED